MSLDELLNLARGMKDLYNESLDDMGKSSPLYSEISSIDERYDERQEIARGGMKTIFKVLDRKTDRFIAMAELHEDASEESYEYFVREARLTANLEHPNIISVHDIGLLENSRPFFTMDLKVGDSLRVILKNLDKCNEEYQERYPLSVLLEIFSKICDAIDYAHSRGVIHLDLKPDNIQIGLHGEVLVCDWGLGKVISDPEADGPSTSTKLDPDLLNNLTQAGELKGTPGYMAPEQAIPNGKKSFQTDIYALGCLLYSILTYKPTVSGSLEEMLDATRKGLIHLPSKVCPEFFISKTLDGIFEKATKLNPENRYASVKEFKKDITNFLAGYSTSVEKGLFLHEVGLFYRRNKTACWTAIALSLILFIVTSLFIFNLNRRIKEADTANKIASHLSNKQLKDHSEHERQLERLSSKFFQNIKEAHNENFYKSPIKTTDKTIQSVNSLLSFGSKNEEIIDLKLKCLLVKLDLNALFALSPEKHPLKNLAKKYALMVHENTLPEDELLNLVNDISDLDLIESLIAYQMKQNPDMNLNPLVISYLTKLNPECEKSKVKYIPEEKVLRVSCSKFKLITNKLETLSVLRFLDVKKIDFRGSGIKSLPKYKELKNIQFVFND